MDSLDENLDVKLVDQDDLETSITKKANQALINKETELDEKRLQKATSDLDKTVKRINLLQKRLDNPRTKLSQRKSLKDEIQWLNENELVPRQQDVDDIKGRLRDNRESLQDEPLAGSNERLAGESERDFLIRTGKITAFGNTTAFAAEEQDSRSHQHLRAPGFSDAEQAVSATEVPKRSLSIKSEDEDEIPVKKRTRKALDSESEYEDNGESDDNAGDDFADLNEDIVEELIDADTDAGAVEMSLSSRNVDDGDELVYQSRLQEWTQRRSQLRKEKSSNEVDSDLPEWRLPHPTIPDAVLNDNFKLPGDIYPSLFDYQKTCVQWLWELYSQKTGGIIGDEMGLGKTIQVIAFLAGLQYSGRLDKPILLVVPATVMNQWVNEFHRWWPPFRCVILHSIGSGMSKSSIKTEQQLEAHLEDADADFDAQISMKSANNQANAKAIVDRVMEKGHVLVTTYVGLRIYSKHILPKEWGYVVLDEGHKIRNPNSEISLACKRVKTYNRIILSGTPIQNNLTELWSLFDFVFPGRLGTLPVFEQQFAIPINMGGYANASNVQVQTGYKCAVILRDLISPYLLRRLKVDVAQDLPKKNEMVLFVKLTQYQQNLYEKFLGSEDVNAILKGKRNVLMGVDMLRKICNHPDLIDREMLLRKKGHNYGNPTKSGKMQVLKNLLQLWQKEGHRTLVFCQTKQMLDILEKFVANMRRVDVQNDQIVEEDYFHYLRMDGSTPIGKRQTLVDSFNNNKYFDCFLLTTKVGGLGVNLTGADRVIIYDPDWNPSTDIQARERAWRLGQTKDITIYRLMTAGTIEEKIYHRQIFKTFLTNKILKDPKQRRFFKMNDLHDLFSLGDPQEKGTETGDMFSGSEKTFRGNKTRKSTQLNKSEHKNDDDLYQVASIMGVSKLDNYVGDEEKEDDKSKDESRLMEGIFANAEVVHSTLQHDEIINSNQQEVSIVEKEAARVAKDAAEALKRSRISARSNTVGTPTWTGKFGVAGRFGPKSKNGDGSSRGGTKSPSQSPAPGASSAISSTSILNQLRQKKANNEGAVKSTGKRKKLTEDDKQKLLEHLIQFLQKQPEGFSKSDTILKALPKTVNLKDEKEMISVRSLLREAATWDATQKGWRLKETFLE
ncbi:hypothetical protein FT663_03761 [Candidozyma haemuli var. vulneris]|nr:hypothetical protein FT663_03761 [[Candida] haemuloni var. vulneris]KAF3991197.1 hypothetical protein FT662_01872 [[Candida] haemuloni var. vulneris]